ncbi:hypothetical protein KEH51_29340 [[Brevibacterium] frigoritolerans]|uniref:Uncharacterized protein n=1 Tax=Peribacillus frigoritolerans TaxID=450367 RepID=A0A941JC49_9BACI|nr:hypothetical protein [Peribacillus frigoritolerans]
MYNYNYAFIPYNVPYYTDGQREPYYDNYYQIMPYYSPDPGPGGGHGGSQWDGHHKKYRAAVCKRGGQALKSHQRQSLTA